MLDGKLSIMDWTCNDVTTFFSFELIEFWSSLVQIAKARQEWEAALRWLEQAARDEPLDKEVHEIPLILQTTPWKAELHILHSCHNSSQKWPSNALTQHDDEDYL
jgi:hypothetical protein